MPICCEIEMQQHLIDAMHKVDNQTCRLFQLFDLIVFYLFLLLMGDLQVVLFPMSFSKELVLFCLPQESYGYVIVVSKHITRI